MKIRLSQASFDGFTGYLGDVYFVDGVSADHVAPAVAHRLAVIMPIETINGEDPSPLTMMHELHYATNENVGEVLRGRYQTLEKESESTEIDATKRVASYESQEEQNALYTKDELEAIADKSGISGLREIGDKHGIKGRSIAELIDELSELTA